MLLYGTLGLSRISLEMDLQSVNLFTAVWIEDCHILAGGIRQIHMGD
jgi:hypothetical protein